MSPPGNINRSQLEQHRAALLADQARALATYHRLTGALNLLASGADSPEFMMARIA